MYLIPRYLSSCAPASVIPLSSTIMSTASDSNSPAHRLVDEKVVDNVSSNTFCNCLLLYGVQRVMQHIGDVFLIFISSSETQVISWQFGRGLHYFTTKH